MPATTASASSSVLPSSLTPKTLSFYTPTKPSSLSFVSLNFRAKPIAVSSPFLNFRPFSSRFVASVAFPSGLGQEEEEEEEVEEGVFSDNGGAEVEPNFSPDLKLFVGNLPFSVDSAHLAGLFETAGNVEMVEVIYDKTTGKSRGFGFVTMSTIEGVEAAVQQFNGYELEGRALRVNTGPPPPRESSFPRGPRGGGGGSFDNANRVYVGNLSWGVDNSTLENLFSEQGKVVEAKVVYDRESGRSRGFGFVTYSSAEEVDSAISSLNGVELDGRSIRVSVAEARPRRQF